MHLDSEMNIYTVRDILFVSNFFSYKKYRYFYFITLLRTDQFPFCTLYII